MASTGLVFKISADMREFRTAMQNTQKSLDRVGKKLKKIGKGMSTYVTAPILAMGAASVVAFDKQAKAIAQVDAAIKSTGGAAGKTSQQLQEMASALQENSLFGDEEILDGVTAQLLTFTNIAGEQFDRTQQAALDLATRLGGDLKGASIQLGKALNDPVANLSALSRSGIQFSEDQKQMIKALVKTNRLADAQTLILNELENQYGGSAKAAAAAGLGPMKQLSNSIGDLTEDFGKIISEALIPVVERVKEVTKWFKGLDDSTKKTIVVVAGLAAAIGPVLGVLGVLATSLGAIAGAVAAINAPMLITVGTIAALVAAGLYLYDNWEAVTDLLSNSWVRIKNAFLDGVIVVVKALTSLHTTVANALGIDIFQKGVDFITDKMEGLKSPVKTATTSFKSFGDTVTSLKNTMIPEVESLSTATTTSMGEISDSVNHTVSGLDDLRQRINGIKPLDKLTVKSVKQVGAAFQQTDEIATIATEHMKANNNAWMQNMGMAGIQALNIGQAVSTALQNTAANVAIAFGEMAASALTGGEGFANFGKMILSSIASFMKQFGTAMVTMATSMIALQKLGSNPVVALAAGIALIAGGAIIANLKEKGPKTDVPAFANGGLVFGPTMGLIGEGAGTTMSNPEVIAPLDKLKSFLGGDERIANNIKLEGVIRGRDISISNNLGSMATANLIGS